MSQWKLSRVVLWVSIYISISNVVRSWQHYQCIHLSGLTRQTGKVKKRITFLLLDKDQIVSEYISIYIQHECPTLAYQYIVIGRRVDYGPVYCHNARRSRIIVETDNTLQPLMSTEEAVRLIWR